MRKRVLGTIAALTAGAGAALGQAPPPAFGPGPGGPVMPAAGYGMPIPPNLNPGEVGLLPADGPPPNGAPTYPPPGFYGASSVPPAGSGPFGTHAWVSAEYLLWFVKAQPTRMPYVTTSGPLQTAGAGQSTTAVISGDRDLGYDLFSGFRVSGGFWCGDDRRTGFELSGFLTERKANAFYAASDASGVPTLARPFLRSGDLAPFTLVISQLGAASGNVLVFSRSQTYGAEGNGVINLFRSCSDSGCRVNVNLLGGFRYLELNEALQISSASTLLGGGGPLFAGVQVNAPGTIGVRDSFEATNRFYGGQLGLRSEAVWGKCYVGITGKIAAGLMNEVLDVNGQSELLDPTRGIATVVQGGLFATAGNIKRYRNDEFAVVPEVNINVGYQLTPGLTTFIGYNFLFMNRVLRPGTSVPRTVNTAQVPTSRDYGAAGVPADNPALTQTDFWLQGVTFGLLFRY
jgi:hypothetical protein